MSMSRDFLNQTLQSACIPCSIGAANLSGLPMGHETLCPGGGGEGGGGGGGGGGERGGGVESNDAMLGNVHVGIWTFLPATL